MRVRISDCASLPSALPKWVNTPDVSKNSVGQEAAICSGANQGNPSLFIPVSTFTCTLSFIPFNLAANASSRAYSAQKMLWDNFK